MLGLSLGLVALFCLLILQFFKIQIMEGDRWSRVAFGQHFFLVSEPFHRGTFYSNTSIKLGHPETPQAFVVDIQKFHLFVDPESIPPQYRDEVARRITGLVKDTQVEVASIREELDKKSRSRRIAMWLDYEQRDALLAMWQPYARKHKIPPNALFFVSDYQRSYPFGKMLGQVLHTVRHYRDETTKQAVPTGGLELAFHTYLKGKVGTRRLMRSPRNALFTGEVIEEPQHGADIYLTINHHLQAICEEEVMKAVDKAGAKCGWAVMMDPYTGEILALAQYPFFYPERYQEYFNDPVLIEHCKVKAVTDVEEPGSAMKPITIAVALKANEECRRRGKPPIFSPDEKIFTGDGHFPGRKELTDTHKHYYLNMNMGLQKSSNVYMGRLIERVVASLGDAWYRKTLHDVFGFGQRTSVELPGESPGMLPTPGKKHPNGALEWSRPTPVSLAIGHNILVNSIQMLRAYSVLANGGYLVQPTLIKRIVREELNGHADVLVDNTDVKRREAFPRTLDPAIVQQVVTAMKFVTKKGGTGTRADVPGYTECGKTGTARKIMNGQYSEKHHFADFVGFVPVKKPAFVLLVAIDEPAVKFIPGVGPSVHASVNAAPAFREIATRALAYIGETPDDPCSLKGDPKYDPKKADWVVEVDKLAEQYRLWNEKK